MFYSILLYYLILVDSAQVLLKTFDFGYTKEEMKYLTILHKGWPQWDIYLAAQCTIKCNGFGLLMLSLDEPENRLFSWEIPIAGRFPQNMFVCMQYTEQCTKGAFNNYVDIVLPFFAPPPLGGQFLYLKPERTKQT